MKPCHWYGRCFVVGLFVQFVWCVEWKWLSMHSEFLIKIVLHNSRMKRE